MILSLLGYTRGLWGLDGIRKYSNCPLWLLPLGKSSTWDISFPRSVKLRLMIRANALVVVVQGEGRGGRGGELRVEGGQGERRGPTAAAVNQGVGLNKPL